MDADACFIDEFGPLQVARSTSVAETGEWIRQAARGGQAIYPVGGRTQLGVGLPPTRPGLVVDLRGLNQVLDYPARDMTITVQTGITVAELQRRLAGENQRLPIDVPQAERATLGGALAVNVSGPRRFAAGTLRDYVIGISTLNDDGQETKAGGRVVKNVAGYDLCKLHIGALGTLGIITQVTLKLRPLPETKVVLTFGCQPQALASLLDALHGSRTRPAAVDLVNGAAALVLSTEAGVALPRSPWVVAVGFEDSGESIAWQVQQLIKEVTATHVEGVEARAGAASEPLWRGLTELTTRPAACLSFKANMLPGAVASFCLQAASCPGILLHAHAGNGIVRGHLMGDLTVGQAVVLLQPLQAAAVSARGNLMLPHCPPAWKRTLEIWGAPRGDAWLMRQVKNKFDPRQLFNPGRFVDGMP